MINVLVLEISPYDFLLNDEMTSSGQETKNASSDVGALYAQ